MANEVEIVITSKDKSKGGFEDAGKEADRYGGRLESVGERADKSEQKILGAKDAVDGVATIMKGPGEQGMAAYLQGWADLASGVANFIVPLVQATVATIRHGIASAVTTVQQKAAAAATRAWAAAQWLLNRAMAMNPIGIVILALTALVAIVIYTYRHSETFRRIVNAAFRTVGAAATWLWERAIKPAFHAIGVAIGAVLSWFRGLPGRIIAVYVGAGKWLYDGGKRILTGLWDGLKAMWSTVIGWFKGLPGKFLEAIGIKSPPQWAIDAGRHIMNGLIKGLGGKDKIVSTVRGMAAGAGRAVAGLAGRALGIAPPSLSGVQSMVKGYASMLYGWTGRQWDALYNLIMGESGFNPNAQNPRSSAYGIFQFLDSTWAGVNAVKTANPNAQTLAGLRYIARSYGNPVNAYSAWLSRSPHWYGSGGLITEPVMGIGLRSGAPYGFGERGVETVTPGDVRGGGRVVLEFRSSGSRVDDLLVELLRSAVRVRGGNVQTVLGRA